MALLKVGPWQILALNNQYRHFAMLGGIASGKSWTGAHFAIQQIRMFPESTGFIGANSYDQLSQATLREFFYWLDHYDYEYVSDRRPPESWGKPPKLKTYKNTICVRRGNHITLIFTRVLAKGNPLRGIEFSWYWIDESRDTPQDTHDIILGRTRESDNVRGLITSSTNGEDWVYKRFVLGNDGSKTYGAMHVPTVEAVRSGIIPLKYYEDMRRAYSPLMAAQELDALHVNVIGGQAYYAFGPDNRLNRAPWGDVRPDRARPLIVGCDFNFQPAPHVWMVGQKGPPEWVDKNGYSGDERIHWFGELSGVGVSSRSMARNLLSQYPNFFYRIFGDASGGIGTTSNAGETDYNQIGLELAAANAMYTIDHDQANPLVRDRVENMNAMAKNAMGETRMTYTAQYCPLFDADVRIVGWKQRIQNGRGKLDNAGDVQRTHASDGAGYAIWKLFPPGRRGTVVGSVKSNLISEMRGAF